MLPGRWRRGGGQNLKPGVSGTVQESTCAAYSNILVNHLLPRFGSMELKEITEEMMQEYLFELLKNGRLDKTGGLGYRGARDILIVLKNTLRDAMRAKLIPVAVFEIKFPVRQAESKIQVLSGLQQQRLIQSIYLNLTSRSAGIILSLYTGMRIGEVCALRWCDIDLEERLIFIRHTLQRVYRKNLNGRGKSKLILTTPKSRSSMRTIPISQLLLPVLLKLKPEEENVFFIGGGTKSVEVRTFRTFFENFLKKNSIEKFHFHALRHTFATRCISAGADCKTVSELLGHASVNMTLNLYVHPQMEQKRKCVELLSEIF